jgi:cell division septum initiation protein DivIVA
MMDKLEQAYAMDLLARLTESIETYLDDDRWDGIDAMHQEIKEANKLVRKYYKRVRAQATLEEQDAKMTEWLTKANAAIREGSV